MSTIQVSVMHPNNPLSCPDSIPLLLVATSGAAIFGRPSYHIGGVYSLCARSTDDGHLQAIYLLDIRLTTDLKPKHRESSDRASGI